VIAAASGMLGIQPDFPLGNVAVKGSRISAQVFFNETYEGISVCPGGNVKIDLGPRGELLALNSSYVPLIAVGNRVQLSSDEAKLGANAVFQRGSSDTLHVDGGSQIIWVKGQEGRFAYQFVSKGHQVVIDAQTGGVLSSWDRKQY